MDVDSSLSLLVTHYFLRILMGSLFLVAYGYLPASAQHGGKAEPNRIQFKRGSTSASVTGSVRANEEAEYVVEARAGQTIRFDLESMPRNSAVVSKLVADDGQPVPLKKEAPGRWTAKLSETGDYMFAVTKSASGPTVTRYRLRIMIE